MGSGGSPGSGASPALVGNAGNPATGGPRGWARRRRRAVGSRRGEPAWWKLRVGWRLPRGRHCARRDRGDGGRRVRRRRRGDGRPVRGGRRARSGARPAAAGPRARVGSRSRSPAPRRWGRTPSPPRRTIPALVPGEVAGGWGAENFAELPVAVDPTTGEVYVGFTSVAGAATIAGVEGVVASTPGRSSPGSPSPRRRRRAALRSERNRRRTHWAAVPATTGARRPLPDRPVPVQQPRGRRDQGRARDRRFGYLSGSDELVAYFGHTQRYDDGVRHQGGYLAAVNGAGSSAHQRLVGQPQPLSAPARRRSPAAILGSATPTRRGSSSPSSRANPDQRHLSIAPPATAPQRPARRLVDWATRSWSLSSPTTRSPRIWTPAPGPTSTDHRRSDPRCRRSRDRSRDLRVPRGDAPGS
jgi:hypothetical protein